ncbi:AtpZ/AtpI family protein [Paracoccus suum]|uniref:AtpZ/AtpI family protein n=1 Tax=Paracoccus suum TaxID=2259340 RepID=UPI001F5419C2|nr:AtpZ/AtpI family protein [Paracoccus suum]
MPSEAETDAQRQQDAARLAALEVKLDARRTAAPSTAGALGKSFDHANQAWRMVIELVAGIVLGFGIGLGLDWLFGTRPILLVLFTLAGFAAGVKTMMRTAREMADANPPPAAAAGRTDTTGGRAADDDDDEDEAH